jgi:sucrose-6-phosphate hydrolase SacC (GH32 family)
VVYDVKKQELSCGKVAAPLKPIDGKVRLRLLVDRGSIEVFGNDGRVALSVGLPFSEDDRKLQVFARGGTAEVMVHPSEMASAWEKP